MWVSSQLATIEVAPPFVAFTMERAAVEQGKQTEIFCKIQLNYAVRGTAKVQLLGLPPKVTTPDLEITKDTKELAFKLTWTRPARPGSTRTSSARSSSMKDGEPVVHNVGGTELRIDVPLPPKADAPPPADADARAAEADRPAEAAGEATDAAGAAAAGARRAREGIADAAGAPSRRRSDAVPMMQPPEASVRDAGPTVRKLSRRLPALLRLDFHDLPIRH